jgi:hypothetical protein
MTNRNTILNELNDIGSILGNYIPQNIYEVPYGYFEGLPTQILNRIKALETTDAKEELEYLSPLLNNISKEMPYAVPVDYFQNLSDDLLQRVTNHADHQTSEEEIESLSPLLSSLKNKNPYSVPAGYFENLETKTEKKEAAVISITKRRWYRLAVAAAIIGVVTISGLLLISNNSVSVNNPQAWVKEKVTKKVSEEKIDEFVKLTKDDSSEKADDTDAAKQAEIKELMKDIPEKDIEEFLNDAVALESNNDTEGIMNE